MYFPLDYDFYTKPPRNNAISLSASDYNFGYMVEITANLHMHTPYSDGERYHHEIAGLAKKAGVDVICVTDHNVYVRGLEGYVNGVMLLVGEEVHDAQRKPQQNHCLIYNANDELSQQAASPQRLVDEANKRGGLAIFAHIVEYGSRVGPDQEAYSWVDWQVQRNAGIEIWNYMSDFKARLWNWPLALLYVLFPSLAVMGPFKAALRRWDELLSEGRQIIAIGNSDAHGIHFSVGPLTREIFPYEYLFRCVNTHLLIDKPFVRDFEADKKLVYEALRAGHCFVGYDLSAPTKGFRFSATSGASKAMMGDALPRRGATKFEVSCPATAQIKLLRNGKVIAAATGKKLEHTAAEPGAYRVECYRPFRLLNRGWIFSNPIYVR